jgi:hypothetical protein
MKFGFAFNGLVVKPFSFYNLASKIQTAPFSNGAHGSLLLE